MNSISMAIDGHFQIGQMPTGMGNLCWYRISEYWLIPGLPSPIGLRFRQTKHAMHGVNQFDRALDSIPNLQCTACTDSRGQCKWLSTYEVVIQSPWGMATPFWLNGASDNGILFFEPQRVKVTRCTWGGLLTSNVHTIDAGARSVGSPCFSGKFGHQDLRFWLPLVGSTFDYKTRGKTRWARGGSSKDHNA